MINKRKKNIIVFSISAILLIGVFFACVLFDNCEALEIAPQVGFSNSPNEQYFGVESFGKVGAIYDYNIALGKFVGTKFDFSDFQHGDVTLKNPSAGTIQMNFFSLNPTLPEYKSHKTRLEPFLLSTNNYEFLLYIPQFGAASKIYTNENLVFNYGNLSKEKGDFESMPTFVSLEFPSAEKLFQPDLPFMRLSIEFLSDENSVTFFEPFLIGENKTIKTIVNSRLTISVIICAFFVVSLATFLVFLFINKETRLISKALVIFAMIVYLSSIVFGSFLDLSPFISRILKAVMPINIAFLSAFSFNENFKKGTWQRKIYLSALIFVGVISLFAVIFSFFSLNFLIVEMTLWCLSIFLFVFSILSLIYCEKPNLFAFLLGIATLFLIVLPTKYFPLYTVSPYVFTLLIIAIFLNAQELLKYRALKKNNDVLMFNFSKEVAVQTQNIKNVVDQKNQLLSFISHDLKKPARFMENFLNILKERESDPKLVDLTNIILSKNAEMISALSSISENSGQNLAQEPFSIIDANELIAKIFKYIEPDCAANGIILSLHNCKRSAMVSAQKNELSSVLTNLIFNAIEHSHCAEISLSTAVTNGFCVISVSDNGIGINKNIDIFKPFISSNDTADNVGLGLFMCKNKIESMGGELLYDNQDIGVTFSVKLPKYFM